MMRDERSSLCRTLERHSNRPRKCGFIDDRTVCFIFVCTKCSIGKSQVSGALRRSCAFVFLFVFSFALRFCLILRSQIVTTLRDDYEERLKENPRHFCSPSLFIRCTLWYFKVVQISLKFYVPIRYFSCDARTIWYLRNEIYKQTEVNVCKCASIRSRAFWLTEKWNRSKSIEISIFISETTIISRQVASGINVNSHTFG